MKIEDILGLGKILPIDKLIDVCTKGIGRLTKDHFDKKDIENEAYRIKLLAQAKTEADVERLKALPAAIQQSYLLTGTEIKHESEGLVISTPKILTEQEKYTIALQEIEKRSQSRLEFQEIKKQLNIENIISLAAAELKDEKEVTDEPIDEDWINRFFRIAEDISTEEMQALWAKILAGEIKQPQSFSLRTLEIVRNLTKEEAETIKLLANFSISHHPLLFIYKGLAGNNQILELFGIKYTNLLEMIEAGIIQPPDNNFLNLSSISSTRKTAMLSGNTVIVFDIPANNRAVSVPIYTFSKAGKEIIKLIDIQPSMDYLAEFATFVKSHGINVQYSTLLKIENDMVHYSEPLLDFEFHPLG